MDSLVLVAYASFAASRTFTSQCCKMARHTLKIFQQMLQDFKSVSDHFTASQSKGLLFNISLEPP